MLDISWTKMQKLINLAKIYYPSSRNVSIGDPLLSLLIFFVLIQRNNPSTSLRTRAAKNAGVSSEREISVPTTN